jgi:ABC-type antimicrobial peptide transport system permease subunit
VTSQVLGLAWYRFRATFGRRWSGLLAVVLLTGLLGGLSMGAIEAARTTESSPLIFANGVHSPDLFVLDGFYNPAAGLNGYNPQLLREIARLPHVEKVESEVGINVGPVGKHDEPLAASEGTGANGSVDGLNFNEDRVIVTHGRLANPKKVNEFVLDAGTAHAFGLHLGETVRIGWVGNTQGDNSLTFKVPKSQQIDMKLVGVGAIDLNDLFQDQDGASNDQIELFTPAFTRRLLECCTNDMVSGITLQGGVRSPYFSVVESDLRHLLPKSVPFTYVQANDVLARAERTLKPESIALGVFGAIAGLAALLIAGQVIGRRIRLNTDELEVLRALGADPQMTVSDGLIGTLGAVLMGTLVAGLVAVGLSPLAPLGPIGPLVPLALRVDWTVVGLGMAVLFVALSTLAVVVAFRSAPHRVVARLERERASNVTRVATSAGLPPAAVTGIRFALEPGVGRNAVPVRSAIFGAVLAVAVVIATITFGSSMTTLVSHPTLYGWNWNADIDGGGGLGDIPAHSVARLLDADPLVGGWSGVYFSTLQIDGVNVPVLGGSPKASVNPPLLSGHAFDAVDQVVLGATTLAQLHKHVGDTVTVGARGTAVTKLRIVGTATLPAIGVLGSSHLEMGSGALLSYTLIPPKARNVFDVQVPGPNAILVRFKRGANPAAGFKSLQSIVRRTPQIKGDGGSVLPVQRPAEILNYRTLGTTPAVLGAALAVGAVIALGLTLVSSVRRRRTDLALLKALGFTKRQLASAIAWQASVAVSIGCIIGIPLGIALGRFLWDLFVHQINAVPDPTVPTISIVLIGVGAVILASWGRRGRGASPRPPRRRSSCAANSGRYDASGRGPGPVTTPNFSRKNVNV